MATLKQIFTKLANDVKKYPNIVQLTKTLDEGFKEVAENISGGGGGGSTVSVTQTQLSGNKIGSITVDSVGTDLYAPKATLSLSGTGNRMLNLNTQVTGNVDVSSVELPVGDTVSYVASQESGTLIGTLTINNVSSLLYAPTPQASVHTYSTTEQVVGKWIDGTTDVYEKTFTVDSIAQGTGYTITHNINNLDTLLTIYGGGKGSTRWFPLALVENDVSYQRYLEVSDTSIFIGSATNAPALTNVVVVMRYLKSS